VDVEAPGDENGNVSRTEKIMATYPKNLPRMHCARAITVA
jgi:hypothetical protein